MGAIVYGPISATFGGTVTGLDQYNWDQGYRPTGNGLTQVEAVADIPFITGTPGAPVDETWGSGSIRRLPTQHDDYHYRFWVIPNSLNLSNPTLGADIPFRIWNTFPDIETLASINVIGSSVLTFDLGPGSVLRDFQYIDTALQIGPGEPTIDAEVQFTFESGMGTLFVRALVASTFTIIPEVPVKEEWRWETDLITTWDGTQSRLSLMENPRIKLDFDVTVVDFEERRILYDLIASAIKVPSLVPQFQYASPLTQTTPLGGSRLYFDPVINNARVGGYVVAINRATRESLLGQVTTIHADGVTLNAALGQEITPPLWYVIPCLTCYLEDGSGLDFGTMAGSFSLRGEATEDFDIERPNSVRTVTTFDSLPVLEWPILITTTERFSYRRDLIDSGIGARVVRSRDKAFVVQRALKFSADRTIDDLDYWRTFFATVRGSQKPFLLTTQLPDLLVRDPVTQGASSITITKNDYIPKYFPLDAFKRIEITYANGQKTYHKVTSAAIDALSVGTISFTPALPNDPAFTNITRISYLQKVKASDTVKLEHFNDYTYVKFSVETVED
ncbi:hypothetical protein Pan1_35 [Pseudanabaena phage Pan1]|nr:hypothetical protein Pan1_35 [Pseudanabaena phage Pan1]